VLEDLGETGRTRTRGPRGTGGRQVAHGPDGGESPDRPKAPGRGRPRRRRRTRGGTTGSTET
jgi:hypothetical protein